MTETAHEVIERLRKSRSLALLRLMDDARLDEPVPLPSGVEAAVHPYRWFLERLGDGIALTKAGYLPPDIVVETMRATGWSQWWIGKYNREDTTQPVRNLRDTARRAGLTRVRKGNLAPTRMGRMLVESPEGLWWQLASTLPAGHDDFERQAGVLYLLAVAAGDRRPDDLLATAMATLGWCAADGAPVTDYEVIIASRDTWTVLDILGLLGGMRARSLDAPPTVGAIEFARAALIGQNGAAPGVAPAPMQPRVNEAIELTITLNDIAPPIWRRVIVPSSMVLADLHDVIQAAMGWRNQHLYSFEIDTRKYGDSISLEDSDDIVDDTTLTIAQAAATTRAFEYVYDFGDGWTHTIVVGRTVPTIGLGAPHLLGGERACPPEDCGGPCEYSRLVSILADRKHPDRPDVLAWLGEEFDPNAFDAEAVNANVDLIHRHSRPRR